MGQRARGRVKKNEDSLPAAGRLVAPLLGMTRVVLWCLAEECFA